MDPFAPARAARFRARLATRFQRPPGSLDYFWLLFLSIHFLK
jgi:hypothetical protein